MKARADWIKVYLQLGSISKADRSRRPHRLARQKWDDEVINLILDIRDTHRYGKIRICSYLLLHHQIKISPSTVARVLEKYNMKRLKRYRKKKHFKRYAKDILGERVQMDVCKIDTSIYQYTAIDDCSRFRILYTYSRRTAKNSANFLERVVEQMPFPVQRVQTDRGREFFGLDFQEKLCEYGIKFRPVRPRSPYLNGKEERSQQTDLQEFYVAANLQDPQLNDRLEEWQFHYNWHRAHSSLKGKTPMDVVTEKSALTALWEDIEAKYDTTKEPISEQNYGWERKLSKCRTKRKPAKN